MTDLIANHLWQSTVFAAAAMLLNLLLRRNSARLRFGIWLAASVKFLVPFSLLVDVGHLFERGQAPAAVLPLSTAVVQLSEPFSFTNVSPVQSAASPVWITVLGVIWAIGCCFVLLRWTVQWMQMQRIVRAAEPLEFVSQIPVRSSPQQIEPGVFGILKPVLLLPERIAERLAPEQLTAIVAHELCHVRRRDNLTAFLHMLVQAIFWFHPLVWWIGWRLLEERERACDEAVIELGNCPEAYAEGILNVCRLCLEPPLPCVSGVTGADLKQRIEEIMTGNFAQRLTATRKLALTVAALTAIAGPISIGVLHTPQVRAQSHLQFDVSTIKPSNPDQRGTRIFIRPGGALEAEGATLKQLIVSAYQVRDFQILEGPSWIASERFDIKAKTAQPEGPEGEPLTEPERTQLETQFKERIKSLLAERFQLAVRIESKEMPIYTLVVGKTGSKLKSSQPDATGNRGLNMDRGVMRGMSAPLELLTRGLSTVLGRPVIDKTGLQGKFDWTLEWTPDPAPSPAGPAAEKSAPPDLSGTSVFTAIQEQLGLKLESAKGPAPVIIIEKAERPSAN